MAKPKAPKPNVGLKEVHARLYADDIVKLKRIAETKRSKWQIELRQLVHRALKIVILDE